MSDLSRPYHKGMSDLYDRIAQDVPKIARGKVWCRSCGRMQRVDGADALRNGWPKCCGATMTIDSPQWRAAQKRKAAAASSPAPEQQGSGIDGVQPCECTLASQIIECKKNCGRTDGVKPSAPTEELALLRRAIERLPKSPSKDDAVRALVVLERAIARGVKVSDSKTS